MSFSTVSSTTEALSLFSGVFTETLISAVLFRPLGDGLCDWKVMWDLLLTDKLVAIKNDCKNVNFDKGNETISGEIFQARQFSQ